MRRRLLVAALLGFGLSIVLSYNGCTHMQGTSTTGNPMTSARVAQYDSVSGSGSLSALSVCVSGIVLTDTNSKITQISYGNQQEIAILSAGTDLPSVEIPSGNYTQIRLVLADQCGAQRSIGIMNTHGTFTNAQNINLGFNGQITIDSTPKLLTFNIQTIAGNLSQATSNSDVANQATANSGTVNSTNNLVLYPNAFTTSPWSRRSATAVPNTTISPDGTNDAWAIKENSATDWHTVFQQGIPYTVNSSVTASLYAKMGANRQYVQIVVQDSIIFIDKIGCIVDLSTGTVTALEHNNNPANPTCTVSSVGNGWYWISMSGVVTPTYTDLEYSIAVNDTGTDWAKYTGLGSAYSIYIFDAVLTSP
jgi:hypothetical protein